VNVLSRETVRVLISKERVRCFKKGRRSTFQVDMKLIFQVGKRSLMYTEKRS
jgi:hypothetical protein